MNFRKRLEEMALTPGMYAYTRESFVLQVITLLETLGIECRHLMRVGVPPKTPESIAMLDCAERVQDDWAREVIRQALLLLPAGTGEFVFMYME